MAMPKRFTEYLGVRLSRHTKKHLDRQAQIMKVKPAVAARIIIEHSVDGMKYEAGKNPQ
jgi:hypothetical protein